MIYRHVLNRLTDEEKGIVLHVVNNMWPIGGIGNVDMETLLAMKMQALHHKLACADHQLKPEHIEDYKTMGSKLGLELVEKK